MDDIKILTSRLESIPLRWDGREAILQMKDGGSRQWRQMEWMGFYFEYLCSGLLAGTGLSMPGHKYGNVEFDVAGGINWDLKAHAVKSHTHTVILNDKAAIDASIGQNGAHGFVIALLDVVYNDDDRSFQQWHDCIKGGRSKYAEENIRRNATSRYRKTSATLTEILLLIVDENSKDVLGEHRQGRNSDGNARRPKYSLDLEETEGLERHTIGF